MPSPRPRILFVCTGNTCRSPMAAALFSHAWHRAHPAGTTDTEPPAVGSAGTGAAQGMPASEGAVAAMAELGIDLSDHRSQPLTAAAVADADLVLTMTVRHKQQVLEMAPAAAGRVFTLREYVGAAADDAAAADIADPFGGDVAVYGATAAEIAAAIELLIKEIEAEGA